MPKRRKGKQGSSGRSSSVSPPPLPPVASEESIIRSRDQISLSTPSASHPSAASASSYAGQSHRKKDDNNKKKKRSSKSGGKGGGGQTKSNENSDLVLTSEKRRGVYECDYCHSDISQLPRIRCAICPDFDLCLDCFATTDHSSTIARMKAAANTHSELKADGIASTMVTGISSAAANHDHTHGYRVCDSTRYPILGPTRMVKINPSATSNTTTTTKSPKEDTATTTSNTDGSNSKNKDDNMDTADNSETATKPTETEGLGARSTNSSQAAAVPGYMIVSEDPKTLWTAEEDLRLLDAIKTHGLGNWIDVSEAVAGNGSVGKTPKRCMERYFDDFLGRYGHILPPYTIVDDSNNDDDSSAIDTSNEDGDEDSVRSSKRRQAAMGRTPGSHSGSSLGGRSRKRYKVVPTESLPGYDNVWPDPYIPPVEGVTMGQEVARDLSSKAELAFVKATANVPTKEEADKIRREWMETRMNQVGAPTVLPPRPDDMCTLPGAELLGFMPRRGDLDIEWENEAEESLADMEFLPSDLPQDKQLKLQVLQIYYEKQNEREKRKNFVLSRGLHNYRKRVEEEEKLPTDELDLVRRMRLFERLHTPEEHKQFIADILKAKRLRKEIAKLQLYRRIGIRSLVEAEKYELDKNRRQVHKLAQLQKEEESKAASAGAGGNSGNLAGGGSGKAGTNAASTIAGGTSSASGGLTVPTPNDTSVAASTAQGIQAVDLLWKQYRTNDRKIRRSINRSNSDTQKPVSSPTAVIATATGTASASAPSDAKQEADEGTDKSTGEEKDKKKLETAEKKKEAKKNKETQVDADKKDAIKNEKKQDTKESDKKDDGNKNNNNKETDKPKESNDGTTKGSSDMEIDDENEKERNKDNNDRTDNDKQGEKRGKSGNGNDKDEEEDVFDIAKSPNYSLLSTRESQLCTRLRLYPTQYLELKKVLIHEALTNGLLDKEGTKRTVIKIDIERRGDVIDFMVRAGWISNKLAIAARGMVTSGASASAGAPFGAAVGTSSDASAGAGPPSAPPSVVSD